MEMLRPQKKTSHASLLLPRKGCELDWVTPASNSTRYRYLCPLPPTPAWISNVTQRISTTMPGYHPCAVTFDPLVRTSSVHRVIIRR